MISGTADGSITVILVIDIPDKHPFLIRSRKARIDAKELSCIYTFKVVYSMICIRIHIPPIP